MQINVVKQNVETPFAGVELLLSVFRKSVPGAFKSLSVMHSCAGTKASSFPKATKDRNTPLSKMNKGLLLSGRNHFVFQSHTFSAFQDTDFLCLKKLYLSNFTAANPAMDRCGHFFVLTLSQKQYK